jgi:hypothetical protein
MRTQSENEDPNARRRQFKTQADQAYQDAIALQPAKRPASKGVTSGVTSRIDSVLRGLAPGFYAPVGARR